MFLFGKKSTHHTLQLPGTFQGKGKIIYEAFYTLCVKNTIMVSLIFHRNSKNKWNSGKLLMV